MDADQAEPGARTRTEPRTIGPRLRGPLFDPLADADDRYPRLAWARSTAFTGSCACDRRQQLWNRPPDTPACPRDLSARGQPDPVQPGAFPAPPVRVLPRPGDYPRGLQPPRSRPGPGASGHRR